MHEQTDASSDSISHLRVHVRNSPAFICSLSLTSFIPADSVLQARTLPAHPHSMSCLHFHSLIGDGSTDGSVFVGCVIWSIY
jgi:hypothetical protein